jgi:O-antigen ligase
VSTDTVAAARVPDLRWWLLLGALLALGLATHWVVAAGVLLALVAHLVRPYDFFTAFLLVIAGATFVEYTAGGLTLQLGMLTCLLLLALGCYALAEGRNLIRIPRTPMTWLVLAFLGLTLLNTARGLLAGHSRKYIGLELLPLLGLGCALLVANVFDRRRDMRWVFFGLVIVGYIAAIRGFLTFAATRAHGTGYALAAPGLVGVLLVNLALRSRTRMAGAGLLVSAIPLFLQQFVTFGRGLWTGCIAALVASVVIYAGFGRGSGHRWKRSGLLFGLLTILGFTGILLTAYAFDQMDLVREAWTRLASSVGTGVSYETRSNLIRLGEYVYAWNLIQESPWIGHGVGYAFAMKQVISLQAGVQWYVHQFFLFIWLKQGLVGLVLFTWMLIAAVALGARETRRRTDPMESAWFATAAAATVFLMVLSLSNFPFGMVNEVFLLALLWGGAMAMTRRGFVTFRWFPSASSRDGEPPAAG